MRKKLYWILQIVSLVRQLTERCWSQTKGLGANLLLSHFAILNTNVIQASLAIPFLFRGIAKGVLRNLDSHEMFRKKLLNFIRSSGKSIFNVYDPQGSKLLNRLRLGFSHLPEHKFRHNFADTVNPLCSCALETESTDHFFLRCQNYVSFRTALMNELSSINSGIISLRPSALLEVILYGDKMLSDNSNQQILTATINYIKNTQRFEQSLF